MLSLTDNGVKIRLNAASSQGGLFWWALALVGLGVLVVVALALLPERLALGALAVFVVLCFVFNFVRQKQAEVRVLSGGILWVQAGSFVHEELGQRTQVVVADGDQVDLFEGRLVIECQNSAVRRYEVVGFDDEREARIMQAVLRGQGLDKRLVQVSIQG